MVRDPRFDRDRDESEERDRERGIIRHRRPIRRRERFRTDERFEHRGESGERDFDRDFRDFDRDFDFRSGRDGSGGPDPVGDRSPDRFDDRTGGRDRDRERRRNIRRVLRGLIGRCVQFHLTNGREVTGFVREVVDGAVRISVAGRTEWLMISRIVWFRPATGRAC